MTIPSENRLPTQGDSEARRKQLYDSIARLTQWIEENEYRGYDTFDGLNAKFVRPLTFESNLLRTILQQGIRRFPLNLRPLLGVTKSRSTKAMGFMARGFIRLNQATGQTAWRDKAEMVLRWLEENQSPGYSGACWGNHFDYQSRTFYLPKGVPTVVWTSLIGHAFLDAYDQYQDVGYLNIAVSSCEHIIKDLETFTDSDGSCISYIPTMNKQVHNANTLGAALLARTYSHTRTAGYRALAEKAIRYTAHKQRLDGSWYYGEAANLHWVDSFHTAYVLDCLQYYAAGTGDERFDACMMKGYTYWKQTFFLEDGTPRYYCNKTLPIDIQCSSQAIDTLVFFRHRDPDALALALKVATWTINHMQDPTGFFYYRRYSRGIVNKTPTLHWGQATMLCALAGLYGSL
ncbi:MAG TPA: hypothetical protein VJX67_02145 [Blastocatellia bacterium]|nr:hypothetical protein [Blastocatellia bacterium]